MDKGQLGPGTPIAVVRKGGQRSDGLLGRLAEGRISLARHRAGIDEFLPDVEAISERRHSPFATMLVVFLFGMVAASVIWMAVSEVDRVAAAAAVVRPIGKAKLINHTDGGRIAEIVTYEGQEVRRGDVLVRFDGVLVGQEIAKQRASYLKLMAEVARLEAEASGATPTFPEQLADQPSIREEQSGLYWSRRDSLMARRAAADGKIVQAVQAAARTRAYLAAKVKIVAQLYGQLVEKEPLMKKGTFARDKYDAIERDHISAVAEVEALRAEMEANRAALENAHHERALVDVDWKRDILDKLTQARADRDRFKAAVAQQEEVLHHLDVIAPESGTVKDLRAIAVGQAFRPGEPILGIVPADEAGLEVEARISNVDRGQVKLDQIATLKFAAYDWIRYGALHGRVTQIDRDASNPATDESGQARAGQPPYFRVVIKLDPDPDTGRARTSLSCGGEACPITSGMTAVAELQLGKRTILEFFTDRIFSMFAGSLRGK